MDKAKLSAIRAKASRGMPLPEHLRAPLACFVKLFGEKEVCDQIGIMRPTLARALGGLGIHKTTIRLIAVACGSA